MISHSIAEQVFVDFWTRYPEVLSSGSGLSIGVDVEQGREVLWVHSETALAWLPTAFGGFEVALDSDKSSAIRQGRLRQYLADHARMMAGWSPRRSWPGLPGSCIGLVSGRAEGSLGCFVERVADGAVFALTCKHVLPMDVARLTGGEVRTWTAGSAQYELGRLANLHTGDFDAACVEVHKPRTNWIAGYGRMSRKVATFEDVQIDVDAKRRPKVVMRGATSGLSFGEITRFKRLVPQLQPSGPIYLVVRPTHRRRANDQGDDHSLSFCGDGDSGAVVCLEADSRPIGLLCRKLKGKNELLTRGMMQSISEILLTSGTKVR